MGNEALLIAVLPIYLKSLEFSISNIGIVIGAFAVGVLALRPLAGKLTDLKSRKFTLNLGIIFFIVSPILYLLSTSFIFLILVRIVHGFGVSFFTTALPAMATDFSSTKNRGITFSYMALGSNLAFGICPIIGLSLFRIHGPKILFVSSSFLAFLALVVSIFIDNVPHNTYNREKHLYGRVVLQRVVLISAILFFIAASITGSINTFLPLQLQKTGNLNVGIYFMAYCLTMIISRFFTAHLSDRYGRGPVFFYGFLISIFAVLLIPRINTLFLMILVAALQGLSCSIYRPALAALVADQTKPDNRGTIFSFYYAAFDIGMASAGLIFGVIADLYDFNIMFHFASMLGAIGLIVFLFNIKPSILQSIWWTLKFETRKKGESVSSPKN